MDVRGYAVMSEQAPLTPWAFTRRDLREDDVAIDIEFSGVCHSDIHTARSEMGPHSVFPAFPATKSSVAYPLWVALFQDLLWANE